MGCLSKPHKTVEQPKSCIYRGLGCFFLEYKEYLISDILDLFTKVGTLIFKIIGNVLSIIELLCKIARQKETAFKHR